MADFCHGYRRGYPPADALCGRSGAWLVVIVVPLLVLMFTRVRATYDRIGAQLQIGQRPPRPRKLSSLVVVPVGGMSRLTVEAISAALSLGDEVVAVTVCYADPEDAAADASCAISGTPGTRTCR